MGGQDAQQQSDIRSNLERTSSADTSSSLPPQLETVPQPAQRKLFSSKFPFMRTSTGSASKDDHDVHPGGPAPDARALASALQQQKSTRRRRGSLRKVALLGRGVASDKGYQASSPLTTQTDAPSSTKERPSDSKAHQAHQYNALGLSASDIVLQTDGPSNGASLGSTASLTSCTDAQEPNAATAYHSTTDEDEGPHLPSRTDSTPVVSRSESYFSGVPSSQSRRRAFQQAKSPLGYSGLSAAPLPPVKVEVDYAATEWWGWIILTVTWIVFVTGMGSCLGVWSWAWDIGKTPYAPPELEDDPTLPIVGYYPALMILTCVMAWVWVVVAWVGMKYFRHAKISGD